MVFFLSSDLGVEALSSRHFPSRLSILASSNLSLSEYDWPMMGRLDPFELTVLGPYFRLLDFFDLIE